MSISRDGASLDAHFPEPAIDLTTLMEGLAEAIPTPTDLATQSSAERWPFLTWDAREQVLALNTRAVLARFWQTRAFKQLGSTFLRNASVPKSRAWAHLGGQIVPGTEGRLRAATDRLVQALDAEIDAGVANGYDLSLLAGSATVETLQILGKRLGCRLEDLLSVQTHLERVEFAPVGPTQQARQSEVARVMAAFEHLDGDRGQHIADFMTAVRSLLQRNGYGERDLDAAIQHHTAQAHETGTQLARFFDFLEDAALARIRVEVGCRMMEALADEASARRSSGDARDAMALLEAYVRRTLGLWGQLRADTGAELSLNLSGVYGEVGEVVFPTEAVTVGFAGCLPVWPAWAAQLFEDDQSGADSSVTRELSYRFRVNGREPSSGKSAFAARLDRFDRDLLQSDEPQRVRRSLAELVFLGAAVPHSEREDVAPDAVLATARELTRRLERDGRAGIAALIADLRGRENAMDRIGTALIDLLKLSGTAVTRSAEGQVWEYHINVSRALVDRQRIASAVSSPLAVDSSPSQEAIDFFRAIQITPDRSMSGSLFSMRVRVRLSERSLRLMDDPSDIALRRRLPERLLPIVWRPFQKQSTGGQTTWTPVVSDGEWLVPKRVEIQYDPKAVGDPRQRQEDALNKVAASRTALAALVYVALQRLMERASEVEDPQPTVSMLRLQQGGRETPPLSGEEGVFAAAQAVEMTLGRDADLRMQGIVLDEATRTSRYKRQGIYGALLAGFPLQIAQESGDRPPIGIVSFAARPCHDHPDLPNLRERRLFLTRTYLATPIEDPLPGYEVRALSSRTEVGPAELSLPETVHEEIRQLYEIHGCRHVILLSHRFAERRVGQQASAARLRDQGNVLRHAAEAFPDLVLYPLVRDTFPATRLRKRQRDEDAFEILHPDEHRHAVPEVARPLRQAYTPVYSLATLHVVGETAVSAKPQSGFCTYFVLGDDGTVPVETVERMRANLLLATSPIRPSLLAALRSIHYLEAERAATGFQAGKPVLDPYDWMAPDSGGKVGEVVVFESSRRRPGSVVLSLTALLDAVSGILHASSERDNPMHRLGRSRDDAK